MALQIEAFQTVIPIQRLILSLLCLLAGLRAGVVLDVSAKPLRLAAYSPALGTSFACRSKHAILKRPTMG